ncbi:cobalamin B12-binding domain-containing protein [Thermosediminibacter litoriperuensis]|uniref:Methylmalonyl-CoA mutase cobalamin-binding domain/chain n=1 Tax=Thermosediminibacter litoriperuensis TaxID=291989 RepID=A0A5S5B1R8_9FIRM|nr:cobalamin-dependent protein [Thermosediminibacter litoriperuensis]TYP59880.1 methylmalonyl-CoA mutase cobalamin-binding domain/chain [Thermosediminibacter litoriperuensis]
MTVQKKKVLLAPLDPVHDIGLKMIKRGLDQAEHDTILLPPDYSPEEIIKTAMDNDVDVILISRTLGYRVAEILGSFIDLAEASGIRERVRIGIGGMAIRPELAAELGFDAGFGPGTTVEEAVAFVEGREYVKEDVSRSKFKKDMTEKYDYTFKNKRIENLLNAIVDGIIDYVKNKTTPGVERAKIRERMLESTDETEVLKLKKEYARLCDNVVKVYYDSGALKEKTRHLTAEELKALETYLEKLKLRINPLKLQHADKNPMVFIQYGTGCPFMDIAHIKTCEAWGADGVVHFDPSWGARTEGFFEGYITHEEDGSVITYENLRIIKDALMPSTLWQVRAHRGLNTPETVLLAGKVGADLTKINIAYGSLGGGTDPERLTVDAVAAIKYAARFDMPFDVVTNEELCGVPAHKAFAGMLIVTMLGLRLGAKPILQPLFCYSPEVMISGQMRDNYVDFNAAKISALRSILNAPIWCGAPIGFLTQTEDRVQSSLSTALHASLASVLGVDGISIASADEAYSGGPISVAARIDTLRATQSAFRFFGHAEITPTRNSEIWASQIVEGIESTLDSVAKNGNFVDALYRGLLGSRGEGAYPGRAGRGTVTSL